MRSREEIENELSNQCKRALEYERANLILIETIASQTCVLLDIRELLQNPKHESGTIDQMLSEDAPPEKDELFDNAVNCVSHNYTKGDAINARQLVGHLHISYGRASALIDQLEAKGIISAKDGAKPRKVL